MNRSYVLPIWKVADNLPALIEALRRDFLSLATVLEQATPTITGVDLNKPIRMAWYEGSTVLWARDTPTCLYTVTATGLSWVDLAMVVNLRYFGGSLVLTKPEPSFTHEMTQHERIYYACVAYDNDVLSFGQMCYMPNTLLHDLLKAHPYVRHGASGLLVVTAADLSDLLDRVTDLGCETVMTVLEVHHADIVRIVPTAVPLVMEFIPGRRLTITSGQNQNDCFVIDHKGLAQ